MKRRGERWEEGKRERKRLRKCSAAVSFFSSPTSHIQN